MNSRLLFVSCLLLAGAQSPAFAAELRFLPSELALNGPQPQRVLLIDEEGGKAIADLTADAQFAIAPAELARFDKGILRPLAEGDATLTASHGGKTASLKLHIAGLKQPPPTRFRNDVIPVLTRSGCNSGACHGALAGKGGLKLSLRGFDPESDHFVLTRQAHSRRVELQKPEESLMLQKATKAMPHGGGDRFADDSPEYALLLDWIKAGGHPPESTEPQLERIDVFPEAARLKPKDKLQIVVRARYSDGTSRDVTRWSRFGSSEDLVAGVSDGGLVTVQGSGEASITIGFGTRVAVVPIASPFPNKVSPEIYAKSPRFNYVDDLVLAKLRSLNIPLSPQTNDNEFIRRIFLDACGILPTPAEVEKFVADKAADKRTKLIDSLLERPEFVDYWAYKWSDLLLVSTRKIPQQAMWSFYRSIRQSVADNKPWDRFARDIIEANGSTLRHGGGNFYALHKDVSDVSESFSVTFLGMSINCARCHNHPLEKWTQDQYWSMANLFSRVGLKNGDAAGENIVYSLTSGDVLHPRRGIAMPPAPLDGKAIGDGNLTDRRTHFADWLTAKDNPYFAKALVNRVWRNFMGRGLVEAEDDIRETNPPTNRELFDALAKDFVDGGFDVKRLVRTVANSAAYQRSSKPVEGNAPDDRFYSRYLPRRLSAEVLLDAISQITDVPTPFALVYTGVEGGTAATSNYPLGTRALQLPDSRVASKFLDALGRPDRTNTCSCERQQDSSVSHALMFNNGSVINDKLRDKNSRVAKWLADKVPDAEVVRQCFMIGLSRQPTAAELDKVHKALLEVEPGKDPKRRREAFEDLLWALSTCKEFMFNH